MNKDDLEKLGKLLKEKREANGLSIQDVSNILKINPYYINSIENADIKAFPAEVFFKGFIKNYANFLKLDISDAFKQDSVIEKSETIKDINIKQSSSKSKNDSKKFSIIPVGYAIIGFIVIFIILSWARVVYINNKAKSEIEKKQNTSFKTMTTVKELALHEQKKKLLSDSGEVKSKEIIIIRAKEDCWVEARTDDTKIYQGLLIGGEERKIAYKKGMYIKLGNAGAVELNVKGEIKKDIGKKGEVKEIIIE